MRLFSFIKRSIAVACVATLLALQTEGFENTEFVVKGVRGRDIELSCGRGNVFLNGMKSYIEWIKGDDEVLYRFPAYESGRTSTPTPEPIDFQCENGLCVDPTSLQLKDLGNNDAGKYRCRLINEASPPVEYTIQLQVVDSPGIPKIFTGNGTDVTGKATYITAGSNLTMNCVASADQSGTILKWERNDVAISRTNPEKAGFLRLPLHITNASRDEQNAHYTCSAESPSDPAPLTASVVIKMYLAPTSVEILVDDKTDFELAQPRAVACVIVGCVPSATVTWHLGSKLLKPSTHQEHHEGNYTVSTLTLSPSSIRDDKLPLICRAHNPHLPKQVFEDKIEINVIFGPVCVTEEKETVGFVVGESDDVICTVKAYPEPLHFRWVLPSGMIVYSGYCNLEKHTYTATLSWEFRDTDQGDLVCTAITLESRKEEHPCVFSMVFATRPETPDCELIDTDPETTQIKCEKNWNGGRHQVIHLLLKSGDRIVQTVTNEVGSFTLPQCRDTNLTAVVYASNILGRSDNMTFEIEATHDDPMADEQKEDKMDALIAVVVGTIVCGVLLAILARCVKYFQDKRGLHRNQDIDEEATISFRTDGALHRQPEPLPHAHNCPHVTLQMTSEGNRYLLQPSKAARVLGIPTVATIKEERYPDLISDEMATFYV